MCVRTTHIIYYNRTNSRVNAGLILLLYVCVAHTHEPNPTTGVPHQGQKKKERRRTGAVKAPAHQELQAPLPRRLRQAL